MKLILAIVSNDDSSKVAKELTKATGMTSRELCIDLLQKTGVVTVPGSGFGECGEGYIRMTYATSDENIRRGFDRIREYIGGLKL